MHKIFASLVTFLCLALIVGYMASEASAAQAASSARTKKPATTATSTQRAKNASRLIKIRATRSSAIRRVAARPTVGETQGLGKAKDILALRSNAALVMDKDSGEILYEKNADAVLPIASITKLMTAMVVIDAALPLDETLTIGQDDVDTEKGTRSRLRLGTGMSRRDALHLALMASENRAAAALGRNFPGGIDAFVEAMNAKAHLLGMNDTRYVDASGLSPSNRSSAADLARLVRAAYDDYPLIRELSTSPRHVVAIGNRQVEFHTTNRLLASEQWDIGLQKTGYISEAGRCLVMEAIIEGRHLVMVLLDSVGKYSRLGDAGRIRAWLEANPDRLPKTVSSGEQAENVDQVAQI